MALGRIPRFAPSFSPGDALVAMRRLARPGAGEEAVVHAFEREFAAFTGVSQAIMVPSARFGLYLLLEAMGIGPGDEVVVPALTYFAIPAFVKLAGARPVFADTGLHTHVLDPESFRAAVTPRTRAVLPTHLFGTPCDLDPIREIAAEHGIAVIEDCAQATGARYRGRVVGGIGDAAYTTFGLTKNMTTLSGAMVTTSNDELAARVRARAESASWRPLAAAWKETAVGLAMFLATHPLVYPLALHPVIALGNRLGRDPIHDRFGEAERTWDTVPDSYDRARPRAVQAAVGRRQLARIQRLNGARARNGRFLDEALAWVPGLGVPEYPEGAEPIYMSFVVHHPRRDLLAAALRRRGVDTTTGYMSNCAASELFPAEARSCPGAERAAAELLHLPVHPRLSRRDLRHMAEAVRVSVRELAQAAG